MKLKAFPKKVPALTYPLFNRMTKALTCRLAAGATMAWHDLARWLAESVAMELRLVPPGVILGAKEYSRAEKSSSGYNVYTDILRLLPFPEMLSILCVYQCHYECYHHSRRVTTDVLKSQ